MIPVKLILSRFPKWQSQSLQSTIKIISARSSSSHRLNFRFFKSASPTRSLNCKWFFIRARYSFQIDSECLKNIPIYFAAIHFSRSKILLIYIYLNQLVLIQLKKNCSRVFYRQQSCFTNFLFIQCPMHLQNSQNSRLIYPVFVLDYFFHQFHL